MKSKLFKSVMLAAVIVAGASSAQAVSTFTRINGDNMDFFYDADFWGGSIASVSGNTLSFADVNGFDSSFTGRKNSSNGYNTNYAYANPGVVAVAHAGYTVGSTITHSVGGSYEVAVNGGNASLYSQYFARSGTFSGDTFTPDPSSYYASYQYGNTAAASDGVGIKSASFTTMTNIYSYDSLVNSSVLGLDTYIQSSASQSGKGFTSSSATSATYGFYAVQDIPVTPVPEPETYAMMLAGLGLLGFTARRKKQVWSA